MRSRSRSSFLIVFCICSILIVGYDGDRDGCVNAQDTPTPTESSNSGSGSDSDSAWYPDTTTTTSLPADTWYPDTSTSTSTSTPTDSTSTSTSTGSWFPWFPTNIPTTTPPVTTDYPTRRPTSASTPTPASDPYYPYPYPTYPPTYPSGPTSYPYHPHPHPHPDPTSPSYPTAYPTAYPTTAPDLVDRGTYWPWETSRGVLPTVEPATSLNPDYDPSSYYVVWVVSQNDSSIANSTVPSPSSSSSSSLISVLVRSSGDGIYFCARYSSWASSRSFYESLYGYNRASYSNGVLEQFVKVSSIDYSRLLMQFSYLDSSNRIPTRHSTATSSSSSYYITARSRMGEFRMFNSRSGWYSDATDMYYACINERGKDGKLYWETVKMVANGQVYLQTAGSRGSTLEHMGAFQWLEYSRYPSSSSSYLLISWRSLSGVRLSRYHEYSWYDSSRASAAYDWNVWYNEMYQPSNNYNYGMNNPVIILYQNGAATRSTYTNYNDFLQLQEDYYSLVHTTTSAPTSRPYPYPYPYPTQSPYPYPYPYPTPSPYKPYNRDFTFTRNWSDLSNADRTFIIAYPIAIIGFGIILILITTCCIKCRDRRGGAAAAAAAAAVAAGAPVTSASSPASVPIASLSARFHNLSTVGILLSFLSLIFLIVALIVNQFSFATFGTYTWVSYGPFSTIQTSPWRGWLNMYWTAQVFGPTTAAVILFNILLLITNAIQLINIKRSNDFTTPARVSHPVITTCACLIMSCTAVMIWFMIHVRLLDPALGQMVIDNFNNSKNYYTYTPFIVKIGTSAILLIIATGIQCAAIVPMCRFIHLARQAQGQGQVPSVLLSVATVDYTRNDSSTSTRAQQAEQDGLQLVQIGSQYYYRAGPAPMPTPAPYVYGVPASGPVSYAPPVASAPPATASVSTYYPGYVPPSFQALAAPIPTTSISVPLSHTAAPAPVPVPAPSPSVYPALPVEVPQSGPNTRYQRLL